MLYLRPEQEKKGGYHIISIYGSADIHTVERNWYGRAGLVYGLRYTILIQWEEQQQQQQQQQQ